MTLHITNLLGAIITLTIITTLAAAYAPITPKLCIGTGGAYGLGWMIFEQIRNRRKEQC